MVVCITVGYHLPGIVRTQTLERDVGDGRRGISLGRITVRSVGSWGRISVGVCGGGCGIGVRVRGRGISVRVSGRRGIRGGVRQSRGVQVVGDARVLLADGREGSINGLGVLADGSAQGADDVLAGRTVGGRVIGHMSGRGSSIVGVGRSGGRIRGGVSRIGGSGGNQGGRMMGVVRVVDVADGRSRGVGGHRGRGARQVSGIDSGQSAQENDELQKSMALTLEDGTNIVVGTVDRSSDQRALTLTAIVEKDFSLFRMLDANTQKI